jgi:hypothetical protein
MSGGMTAAITTLLFPTGAKAISQSSLRRGLVPKKPSVALTALALGDGWSVSRAIRPTAIGVRLNLTWSERPSVVPLLRLPQPQPSVVPLLRLPQPQPPDPGFV